MRAFMNDDFLLTNDTAKCLFHEHAEKMPILDFHCHIDPKEIYEDVPYTNITQAWLSFDHYKWRAIRANGVEERFITGDAADYEKFQKYAEAIPRLIGNPLYHWTHLELKTYFGIHEPLSGQSCKQIWEECNALLPKLTPRKIVSMSNVKLICTTDDPTDELIWHKKLKKDPSWKTAVLPTFRPDLALYIEKPGFQAYIAKLRDCAGKDIRSVEDVFEALKFRMDLFSSLGCRAADHGFNRVPYRIDGDPDAALRRALAGEALSAGEIEAYQTALMTLLAGEYKRRGFVMQLHYGVIRNVNPSAYRALGPDRGFDVIAGGGEPGMALAGLMGRMADGDGLPKTIIYPLNPGDNAQVGAVIGAFQRPEIPMYVQQGSAWWFSDTKQGMIDQLTSLANLSALGNFVGMLTDSRSFLSYARHGYFRRILCQLVGGWVENGEYPGDMEYLGGLIEDVCCNNAGRFFDFHGEQ